jgi:predicted restriction endonuclease
MKFLIASHIKPWRDSNNEEKLDGNNGLLLSPHLDKLFDKGFISFSELGEILISSSEVGIILKKWGIDTNINIGGFNRKQKEYLDYHRQKIFQKKEKN